MSTRKVEPIIIDASEIRHEGYKACIVADCGMPAVGIDTEYNEPYCFAHYIQQMDSTEPFAEEWKWFTQAEEPSPLREVDPIEV